MKNRSKGFTLLELLIVLVILGIIAGLYFPVYLQTVDKFKAQEAYTALGSIRAAMTRYYSEHNTFVGASIIPGTANFIGVDPLAAGTGQAGNFRYDWINQNATQYVITATCTTCSTPGTVTATHAIVVASGSMA